MRNPQTLLTPGLAAGLIVLAIPAAAASPDPDAAFKNTFVSTYADGTTESIWLDRDGVYHSDGKRGKSDGHWRVTGGKLCLKQSHPFPVPFSFCSPTRDNVTVGSKWSSKSYTGEMVQVTMVAGRPG